MAAERPLFTCVYPFGEGVAPPPPEATVAILGGKGRSLVDLVRGGFDVPPGFIISTECCRCRPPGLETELREALAWLEQTTGARLGDGLRLAVRSGAPVSMPGMMDTVLNVDTWPALQQAIDRVFASWDSPRARSYRSRHGLTGLPGTAAVVQAMFPSERAGVAFTEDPDRPDAGRIVVEAAPGLGEAVVSGAVEPDRWVVARATRAVLEAPPASPCLTHDQLLAVVDLALRVEAHFGAPVDLEWGLAGGRIAALQARPIRGLDVARAVPRVRARELQRLARRRGAAWVGSNLGETLPAPTPLTWDLIGCRLMRAGVARMYADFGYAPSRRVRNEGFLELICGRVYADLERTAELFFGPTPLEYDPALPDTLSGRPTRFNIEKAGARFLLRLPLVAFRMVRASRRIAFAGRTCVDDIRTRVFPRLQDWLRNPSGLAAVETAVLDDFGPELLKPGFLAAHFYSRLCATLVDAFGPDEGRRLTAGLLAGLDGDRTVDLNQALFDVAHGVRDIDAFLAEFGHRAVNEFELAEPRWREDPSYPLRRIEQMRRGGPSPRERHERRRRERLALEASLGDLLREAGASSLEAGARADLAAAQRFAAFREECKDRFMMALAELRRAIEALGLGRDAYWMRREELQAPPADVASRRIEWEAARRIALPDVILADRIEEIGSAPPAGSLQGVGVSVGAASGPAAVVSDPDDAPEMGPGYVLVCPSTDPGWTPLLAHAAALVVERGGMLSHGVIVARDFGVPAVVLPGATRTIPRGRRVRVDGGTGRVELL